jgi:hypothetical protein
MSAFGRRGTTGGVDGPAKGYPEEPVERTRAWTGLWVVVAGDLLIFGGALVAVLKLTSNGTSATAIVSIMTSAFTTIGTMTTAYFGIKSASTTAQTSLNNTRMTAHPGTAPAAPAGSASPASAAVPPGDEAGAPPH